jgi:colanic acid/amylovoran biosynthesis glycosyltransferase
MKIAFIVERFPVLSETFVLNQITGLTDRGHDLDIFARTAPDRLLHPDVRQHELVNRTHYWPSVPVRKWLRWLNGLRLLARQVASRPRVLLAANVAAYGTSFYGYDLSSELQKRGAGLYSRLFRRT